MRPIDADALERDGWQMSRTVRISKDTMEFQTRKPTDFPAIEPQRMRGKWNKYDDGWEDYWECSVCRNEFTLIDDTTPEINNYHFCPYCGAEMERQDGQTNR